MENDLSRRVAERSRVTGTSVASGNVAAGSADLNDLLNILLNDELSEETKVEKIQKFEDGVRRREAEREKNTVEGRREQAELERQEAQAKFDAQNDTEAGDALSQNNAEQNANAQSLLDNAPGDDINLGDRFSSLANKLERDAKQLYALELAEKDKIESQYYNRKLPVKETDGEDDRDVTAEALPPDISIASGTLAIGGFSRELKKETDNLFNLVAGEGGDPSEITAADILNHVGNPEVKASLEKIQNLSRNTLAMTFLAEGEREDNFYLGNPINFRAG